MMNPLKPSASRQQLTPSNSTPWRWLIGGMVLAGLCGCGQKGPLYLPKVSVAETYSPVNNAEPYRLAVLADLAD